MDTVIELAILLLLVALNGAFALSELAIVSARRGRLLTLQRMGRPGATAALALAEDPQRFLPTVQVGISLVGIVAGVFGGARLAGPLAELLAKIPGFAPLATETAFFLVVVAITYANLILGELVPKQLALRDPEKFAVVVARPMAWLARWTGPVVWVLGQSSNLFLRLLGATGPQDQAVTEEEVKAVVAEGVEAGALEREERHMIERVLRLADKPVRALMTPRNDVAWIDRNATAPDIAAAIRAHTVTRFVVADGRIDNVVGVVVAKDLLDLALEGEALSLGRALRQPLVLPDNLSAMDALERMRHDPLGIALVLDEYGSFEGVVTASDLLEAIIGELGPEEQPATPGEAVQRADGSLLLDGMMPSDELRARLDLPELPARGTYHTVAGLMLALLRRVPREGDRIVWAGWRFEIIDMDGRRVDKVLASKEELPAA
ncbi:hemolysin family protein [Siccirubricoccus phaeus]|uniref:hemolysin family protein n=1 Tax=Siccirubricoccus phaeus TaxID=2595053 RepID=UPI0011F1F32C|nr:hemolysin family protein [Siccirubricoccus phaeus]